MKKNHRKTSRKSQYKSKSSRFFNTILLIISSFLSAIIFYIMFTYNFIAFKNLNYIYTLVIILLLIVLFFLNWSGRLRKTTSFLLVLLLLTLGITGFSFYSAIKLTDNLNKTTQSSEIEMSVVVPKDSSITSIEQIQTLSIANDSDSQNTEVFLGEIKDDKGVEFNTENLETYQKAYEKLLSDSNSAMVLNSAYSSLLETIYPDYKDKIKTLYTYKIEKEVQNKTSKTLNSNVFNIYISGIDTYGDISSVSRSDVNIIMTVNMNTHKVLLTTTPRDSYVKIPDGGGDQYDKLTHAGIYGVETSMKTLEGLYGIDIDYYTRVNFTSFLKLIDLLGGVEVYNDQAFTSLHGNYDFPVGKITLDSDKALGFIRERYSLAGGDNDRGKNQEKVIAAIINKMTKKSSLVKIPQIVENLQSSVQTNMSLESINKLVNRQLSTDQHFTVTSQAVTGTGSTGQLTSYAMPNASLYMMSLDETSISQAKSQINMIMEGK